MSCCFASAGFVSFSDAVVCVSTFFASATSAAFVGFGILLQLRYRQPQRFRVDFFDRLPMSSSAAAFISCCRRLRPVSALNSFGCGDHRRLDLFGLAFLLQPLFRRLRRFAFGCRFGAAFAAELLAHPARICLGCRVLQFLLGLRLFVARNLDRDMAIMTLLPIRTTLRCRTQTASILCAVPYRQNRTLPRDRQDRSRYSPAPP